MKRVEFAGEPALDPRELRGGLQALRARRLVPGIPHVWKGWRLLPSYSEQAVNSDAARLLSLYLAKGCFDAIVAPAEAEVSGSAVKVVFHIQAGPRYAVRQWSVENTAGQGWNPAAVCSAFFCGEAQRGAAGHT